MNIKPILELLDEMLLDLGDIPDSVSAIARIRMLMLRGQQEDELNLDDLTDVPAGSIGTPASRLGIETSRERKMRKDRERKQRYRDEARAAKALPPLIKDKRDIWTPSGNAKAAQVPCPLCFAPAGERCRMMTKRGSGAKVRKPMEPRNGSHEGRKQLAKREGFKL